MNRFCMIACAVAVAAADLAAAELQTLWWSKRLNAPERFDRNSSGRVTVSRDEAEQAVRFDVEFTPETDFWVYPRLRFRGGESFAGVDEIRFEFKAKQQGQPGGVHGVVDGAVEGPEQLLLHPPHHQEQTLCGEALIQQHPAGQRRRWW